MAAALKSEGGSFHDINAPNLYLKLSSHFAKEFTKCNGEHSKKHSINHFMLVLVVEVIILIRSTKKNKIL